ncbi:MAG: phosphonate C-P lyase system protein PhnG [Clostridiales bacterium]|jgi:alpha-D-ribose 1-methylphosphonate 5-triphosphate synthase subunit PhnG|nr:phosphonate C-P lyase system protein PhnG [Clostridiales bacterium]
MQRKRRTTILVKSGKQLAKLFAGEIIQNYPVVTVQEPQNGLIMIKMRESAQNKLFYLGEVFVTECKVQVGNVLGVGIIQDDQPEMAYYLALIDAAYNADLAETKRWEAMLTEEENRIMAREAQERFTLLKTTVNFETMDVLGGATN